MSEIVRKTSQEWSRKYPYIIVMDPDGWDRKNYQYSWFEELITEEIFNARLERSTCLVQKPKKIIYLDMDGVLADLAKHFAVLAPDLVMGDGPDWEERSKRFIQICNENPSVFLDLELMEEDTVEVVKEMMDLFDVYFLSTPMWKHKQSFSDKAHWLDKHFGDCAEDRLILTKYKNLNEGHYLVDDTKRNGVEGFKGKHIHYGTDPRFLTLRSVLNYLKENEQV